MSASTLPDVVAHGDGTITATLVADPALLYAWTTIDLESGLTWVSVYRSVLVRDTDTLFAPALELIGGTDLLSREAIEDGEMMFGRGELSIYAAAE